MKMPPTFGRRAAIYSEISFAGDMGYPAKNRHPAIIAASTQASFPCQKSVLEAIFHAASFPFIVDITLNVIGVFYA
jgi:hypothetical protein